MATLREARFVGANVNVDGVADHEVIEGVAGYVIKVHQMALTVAGPEGANLVFKDGADNELATFLETTTLILDDPSTNDEERFLMTCDTGEGLILVLDADVSVGGCIWYSLIRT